MYLTHPVSLRERRALSDCNVYAKIMYIVQYKRLLDCLTGVP